MGQWLQLRGTPRAQFIEPWLRARLGAVKSADPTLASAQYVTRSRVPSNNAAFEYECSVGVSPTRFVIASTGNNHASV
jgi:hypothetical protein